MIDPNLIKQQIHETARGARQQMGLLTEEEVAAILQLNSVTTLATWRSQKKGPPSMKLGKRVFYSLQDLAGWVSNTAREQLNDNNQQAAA
jgi:predicted DNA-binding transcriptional regulator AlpA